MRASGLGRHDGVSGGVGFIEAVAGEFFEQIEDSICFAGGNAVGFGAALDERFALGGHFLGLFLAHGAPEEIRAAQGVTGEGLGRLHHLLLVYHNPVGLAADGLEQRMLVFDRHFALPPLDKLRDQFHRPWPETTRSRP